MPFSTLPFLAGFLPLFITGAALCGRFSGQAVKLWLLAASMLFCWIASPWSLAVAAGSIAGHFLLLRGMAGSPCPGRWAACGIVADVMLLAGCKFLTGGTPPLGLSFFTFTQIGYLLFCAQGFEIPRRFTDYALFAGFFPCLLAGPVLNTREGLPQFTTDWAGPLQPDNLWRGSAFFVLGLLKKVLLADPLAPVVASAFAQADSLTLLPAWHAAAAYSLQLYFDFSGYTDMAIGLGCMVGLTLPDNFDQPYRARSVIDYWQRWHISLTRFLMTHLHAPLTMRIMRWRRSRGRCTGGLSAFTLTMALPVAVTMLAVALWHGDRWTYIVFGLLHTGFLLINHAWRQARGPALPATQSIALTYLCVLFASVVFRAETLPQAGMILDAMLGRQGVGHLSSDPRAWADAAWIAALYGIVHLAPATRQIVAWAAQAGGAQARGWGITLGCAATLGILACCGTGEFLYFRF